MDFPGEVPGTRVISLSPVIVDLKFILQQLGCPVRAFMGPELEAIYNNALLLFLAYFSYLKK
jgi:hypothetical protein